MQLTIKYITKLLLVVLMFFQLSVLVAQSEKTYITKDIESWAKASVEFEVHKKFEIGLSEAVRLEHNSSQLNQFFTEMDLKYTPVKRFDIGAGLRFMEYKKDDGLEPNLRFFTYVAYKHNIERFSLKYRLKYQNTNDLTKSSDDGDELIHHLRLQTTLAYNIKKWKLDPKLSVELFNRFDQEDGADLDKIRIKFGSEYKFKQAGALGFFFGYERELTANYPKNTSIFGIDYKFKVERKKKGSAPEESQLDIVPIK